MPAVAKLARFAAAAILLAAIPARAQTPPPSAPLPPSPRVLGEPQPDPITLDIDLRIGGVHRFGEGSSLPIVTRANAIVGAGVTIAPSYRWAVGLAYEHSGLGEEHGRGDVADVNATRTTDALWATLKLTLLRVDRFAFALTLGPGLAWQHVDADVILFAAGARPEVFRCQETGGPGLGLRAGLGVEAMLGGGFYFSADAIADNLRLSSDALGECAPGAGSVTLLGARAAISYRFDVSRYTR